MAKTKNIVKRCIIATIWMFWCVLWAKVSLQPLYSDARFQPTDKLHAGCTNSADILFSPQWQKITKITLVLYYNPDTIEILRVLPTANNGITSSKIEYNRIVLEVQDPVFSTSSDATSFFQLYFKSTIAGKENIILWTWSEAVTASKKYPLTDIFVLNFAQVPECEPDVVPPSINLIYPKDTQERIALDQYFVFDIKDIGKWVDKNSVIIHFNGEQYFYGSDNLKRNGNYLTFYPGKWIPINTGIDLKISVTDKQSYGWANKAQSTYSFQTATGIVFNKDTTPMMFRQIVQEAEKIVASAHECTLLWTLYTTSDIMNQKDFKSIIQKVWCNLNTLDTSVITPGKTPIVGMTNQQKIYRNLSIFATLGWILFFISFTLKIHYLLWYKRHKKLYTESQKFKINN